MSSYKHLPEAAGEIAGGQGWDEESLVIHLAGFISSKGLDEELTQYLSQAAAEEEFGLDEDYDDQGNLRAGCGHNDV